MKYLVHLAIYLHQQRVVAVTGGGVGPFGGSLVGIEGLGQESFDMVGTAEEVVGTGLLVAGAVAVVVADDGLQEGVGQIGRVEFLQGVDECQLTVIAVVAAGQQQDRGKEKW